MTPEQHLAKADPVLGKFIKKAGPIALPKPAHKEPCTSLLNSVAHQQLHGTAATAILGRMMALCGGAMPDPASLLALTDAQLRACGFSGSKILALRDIAAKAQAGVIPTRAQARRLSDEALIERLTQVRGVGRWTVEMLLIFTLRRPDVFPVDDFGVREGYRVLHGLPAQPKPKEFAAIGAIYAPHRSLASLYFWRAADLAKPAKKPPAPRKKQA
jgi:DNA-3-methyladenine glycosylase II